MPQATDIVKSTIRRDGVSQRQRKSPALDPASIKIDERTLEDFLVFAQEFARQVRFYDLTDQPAGDWQDFWKYDPTIVIAAIEKTNPLPLKKTYDQLLLDAPSVTGLHQLIRTLLGLARQIDDWHVSLPDRSSFKTELKRLIDANFDALLPLLASYEKGAKALFPTYPEPSVADYLGFSSGWHFQESAWKDMEANTSLFRPKVEIGAEEAVACMNEAGAAERLAAAYQRLGELLTSTYNVYFQVIQVSPGYFQDSLTRRDHPPHLALFIAFLMLYQQVQNDLNGLPGKHLDFFYKEVLGLKTRPASPDKVHLFFELAKNIPAYELLANIRFKAGKDDTGKNLFYALDKNTVLSAAQVESLHTVFLDLEGDINTQSRKVKNIHVAPVANSGDGLGAPVKDKENPSWATLGSTQMPPASLGIAIASNELLLGEGTRQITLLIYPTKSAPADLSPRLDIYLSGKKGWIPVETYTAAVDASDPAAIKPIKITCTLGPEAPPILPFNAKIFKENLGTMLPVMKLLLHQPKSGEAAGHYDYEALRQLKIYKVQLEVDVKNLQQIVAFSDEGAVDATKPFMPFGSNPKVGSSFYVGNAEAFQKSLDKVTLKLVWEGVPKNFSTHYRGYDLALENNAVKMAPSDFGIKTFVLKNGTPQEITGATDSTILFGSVTNDTVDPMGVINHSHQLNITTANLGHAFPPDNIANYGLTPKNGFLRIDLQRDFEHDQFQNVLTRQMLAAAKLPAGVAGAYYDTSGAVAKATSNVIAANAEVIIPKAPYTPVLKSVTLDYTSMVNTADDAADLHVLHLYPFANTYQYLAFPNPRPEKTEAPFLLPQFTTKQTDPSVDREEVDPGMAAGPLPVTAAKKTGPKGSVAKFSQLPSPLPQPTSLEQGALLIGLRQLQPLDSLSLLFQVAENSADAEIPKAKLRWHYLAGNKWLAFQDYQIASDTTDELTTSGIVALSIPEDINRENTILSPELHWLKISVTQHVGAVSRLLNVHTQAVRATFQENGNDPARFATPLVAQTIAKLEVADSALKSISQPYESFGGQPAEAPLRFYTRVSERLRHKGRAITQFDYERLVLDAFPTIYKVKCVNHTDQQYNLHPGHVLVCVVPDFTKLKAVDRLQPKVTLAKLEEIKRYLEERNTAFVCQADTTLHVLNPVYQKIRVDFEVRFRPEVTAVDFHKRKLQEGIIRFLSPWAYADGAEINFGGKMYRSSILNFVEEQSYVDYVAHFKMMRDDNDQDLSEIEADTPRSVLVPATANEIVVKPILIEGYCPAENLQKGQSLGYLTLAETQITS